MNIGSKIKKMRLAVGMSQEDLANKIKMSISSVKKYEGATYLNLETIEDISKALGVHIITLISDDAENLFDLFIKQYNLTNLDQKEIDKLKIEFEFALGYLAYKYDDRK